MVDVKENQNDCVHEGYVKCFSGVSQKGILLISWNLVLTLYLFGRYQTRIFCLPLPSLLGQGLPATVPCAQPQGRLAVPTRRG